MKNILEQGAEAMRVSFFFAWFDMWIGAYWSKESQALYICPLPMCVIKIAKAEGNNE